MLAGLRQRISYDPFLADEDARHAAEALNAGDWIPTMALMRDTSDRSLRLNMLTSEAVDTSAFHTWVDAHPTGLSLTMLAMRQMTDAWPSAEPSRVTRRRTRSTKRFGPNFGSPIRPSPRHVRKDPEMVDAWAAAVPIATGLGLGVQSARNRFERAHSLHPFHRNATTSMLRASFARWGGSHDEMFEFARLATENTPADSEVQSALPIAHLEFIAANGDGSDHLSGHDNKRELHRVVNRFLQATPPTPAPPAQLEALNCFVAVLGRMSPRPDKLLSECVKRIDSRATPVPWRRGDNDLAETYASFIKHLR